MTRIRLGMLTPSSNTVLEPATAAMLATTPDITAHFARFRVTRIALAPDALAQFDIAPVLEAASLLADARMDVIAWSGTSAGWLGFDSDRALCAAITAATGIPATTATLALEYALARLGAATMGLVTPYTPDIQQRIIANFAAAGTRTLAERHLDDPGNFSFSEYEPPLLEALLHEVAGHHPQAPQPDVLMAYCTNLRASALAPAVEQATGLLLLDSISATVWHSLLRAGADPVRIQGWGRLFTLS